MNKNKKIAISLLGIVSIATSATVAFASNRSILAKAQYSNPAAGTWVHYAQSAPTASAKGTREYWVGCSEHTHVFSESEVPEGATIVNGESIDTSGFTENDDRWLNFKYDEDHVGFNEYKYGAKMYLAYSSDVNYSVGAYEWRMTCEADTIKNNLFGNNTSDRFVWRIDLPRIDYTKYPTVTMKVLAPNWYENNMMGPEMDKLTYHTNYGGNKTEGKITLTLGPTGLHMSFNSLEYANQEAFNGDFTDIDIIHGNKSAYFYTEDLYDRFLNITDIQLSTESTKTALVHFNGDTTAISVANGTVGLPGNIDYSIISNNYGTDQNSLLAKGNDTNTGALAITMPAFNIGANLSAGVITFKFGVRNNNEIMYWGSGENRVSLGRNDSASQTNNNNGYVNWELQLTSSSAKVFNAYEDRYIDVTLSEAMLAGTAGIVISGGDDCRWRQYFVTDIYWSLSL